VALEAAFEKLFSELRKLQDTLVAVRLTVVEDKPVRGEAALVDKMGDTILDIMGSIDEALRAARSARKAIGNPMDLNGARRALAICQARFHRAGQEFAGELVSYERLKDLARLGNERRGEWIPWANSAKQGIEQCRYPLDEAGKALAACWEEIAERVGTTSISVQATNIGQKIVTAGDREASFEKEHAL
jgi:hypothetical protein